MFYQFRQNNSGGSFDYDFKAGISVNVIIEADSLEEAVDRAKNIGLYFNGVDEGIDCDCCGDRWHEPWDADEVPSNYGEPIEEGKMKKSTFNIKWIKDGPEGFIHYKDGTVVAVDY